MEKRTPLYDAHLAAGGKIVPFAGYLLPVQYSGIVAEHMAVRTAAGLFDVSHMGEVTYRGADALANLQQLLTNDFAAMADGQVKYSPMCNENGGVIDDLLVYRRGENDYMVVVNAANREKDVAWMQKHLFGDVEFADISDDMAQLALQGPRAQEILATVCDPALLACKYYTFCDNVAVGGITCTLSRTGYTGEDGFELYVKCEDAAALWNLLLQAGEPFGLVPCGLGARDTLRLEAGMPLYGHEMDETVSPLEMGLGFFVKREKPAFIGKAAFLQAGDPKRFRIGLVLTERGIARQGDAVLLNGEQIGAVTSGTMAPYCKQAVAMALVSQKLAPGETVAVQVRAKTLGAKTVALPFYKREKN